MPCPLCKNAVGAGRIPEGDPYLLTISAADSNSFDVSTDADVQATCETLIALKRRRVSAAAFEREHKAYGVNYNPQGILFNRALRPYFSPMAGVRFDSMHIWFSNGIANIEGYNLLRALETRGVEWGMVEEWFGSDIKAPAGIRLRSLRHLFNANLRKLSISHKMLRGQASEIKTIVPLLLHFVESVLPASEKRALQPFLESFSCLAEVVSMLGRAKKNLVP